MNSGNFSAFFTMIFFSIALRAVISTGTSLGVMVPSTGVMLSNSLSKVWC